MPKLIKWSFSKAGCYEQCPFLYESKYHKKIKDENNAFSQYGEFCHKLFEMYNKGEKEFYQLIDIYRSEYENNIKEKFPYMAWCDLSQIYYNDGDNFFSNFDGFQTKTLSSEQKIKFDLTLSNGRVEKIVGIIDRVYETSDGSYGIEDYKTKKKFKSKKEQKKYFNQLYLYSAYFKQKYGKFPKELCLYLFRGEGPIVIEFNEDDYNKAIEYFTYTIEKIYKENEFNKTPDEFYCRNLCGISCFDCEYRNDEIWINKDRE